jgi:uncharacterized protein YjbJ (UPF0337 family)
MAQTRMKERIDALYERAQAENGDLSADYGNPRLRQAEFNIMIDEMLGADYDPQKRIRLLEIQESLGARQRYLDAALDNGRMTGDAYLARLREVLDDTAEAYAAVLGHEDYVTLFGADPNEASNIIDPSVLSTSPVTKTRRRNKRGTNWDRIEGNWKQLQGKMQLQWGMLTNDDLALVEGRRRELVGRIQERYGITRDEAERQVAEWETGL